VVLIVYAAVESLLMCAYF